MHADPMPDLTTPSLCAALALQTPGELISIVGGGGKSALLFGLAHSLPGCTVLTTTTHIFASQTARAAATCRIGTPEFAAAMHPPRNGLLVIGEVAGEKARGVAPDVPSTLLAAAGVDFVVVEADGSRMLPAKAPAPHEPVVPEETTLLVIVAGIDALAGPIAETCHRPERVSALLGLSQDDCLDPPRLAELLCHPEAGQKGAPAGARIALLINKIEAPAQWRAGRVVAAIARRNPRIERVVLGALEPSGQSPEAGVGFEVWLGESARLSEISSGTLRHYQERAQSFFEGTRDHDVSQNLDALLSAIGGEGRQRILDLGCGPGRDLLAFKERGQDPVGLDGAEAFVRMARAHSGVEVRQQDLLKLELVAAEFDGVFANASLFHVPCSELPRVLRELLEALRPGGVLFSSNPRGENNEGWSRGRYAVFHDFAQWRRFVLGAGFEEVGHYYRPEGLPRDQQGWLASLWRRPAAS